MRTWNKAIHLVTTREKQWRHNTKWIEEDSLIVRSCFPSLASHGLGKTRDTCFPSSTWNILKPINCSILQALLFACHLHTCSLNFSASFYFCLFSSCLLLIRIILLNSSPHYYPSLSVISESACLNYNWWQL